MLEQIETGQFIQDLKMNVLQAIEYIIQGWDEVTDSTIKNCWNHVKILPDTISREIYDDDNDDDELMIEIEIEEAIEALNLPNTMQVQEFLTIPEENIVYEIPTISELANLFKDGPVNHPDEDDDSVEMETICINEALQSLKIVNSFLLQQEDASKYIKFVSKVESFIKRRMQQSTIDRYFK
jgi:hypothetical protein